MRTVTKSQTAAGSSSWAPMDRNLVPFNVGFGVVVTGTVNYTVEHTFDNVFDATVTPVAFPHPFAAAQTTNQDGNYSYPVIAIRVTVNSGTGTAALTLVQGAGK